MFEKLSYFEFLMYLLPGALIEFALLGAWSASSLPPPEIMGQNGILASIVFILAAFILGHIIQAIAQWLPDKFLQWLFWKGYYPSVIMLFKDQMVISNSRRAQVIELLHKETLLEIDDRKKLDEISVPSRFHFLLNKMLNKFKWIKYRVELLLFKLNYLSTKPDKPVYESDFELVADASQKAWERARINLVELGRGKKIETFEAYFQFFRGAAVASSIAAILFGLEYWYLRQIPTHLAAHPNVEKLLMAGMWTSFFLTVVFTTRTKEFAERFAVEVIKAYDAYCINRKILADSTHKPHIPNFE